ncbi:MAG TPA: ABC transporter permease [Candidatus Acidoferrum sp.]|nr:ABC transporter permease [Candidatus Acidoferrum sp.]
MTLGSRFRSWTRTVLRRSRMESEMDAELRFHIEAFAEDLASRGVPRGEAMRRARIEFGGIERVKEEGREARGTRILDELRQDFRYGVRMFRKSPGFTAVAVLTLALGIGANTAIFSVVNAVLLSPLPYANAHRLMLVKETLPNLSAEPFNVSGPDIAEIQKLNHVFEGVGGFRVWTYEFSGRGEPARVTANRISSDLFDMLGVQPVVGREFEPQEEQSGNEVVILSYGFWQRQFGGQKNIVRQTLNLDRKPYTIVGVMPQNFVFPLPGMMQGVSADLWVPLGLSKEELADFGDNFSYTVVGKLRPGIQPGQVNGDLQLVARGVLDTYQQWARDENQPLGDFRLGMVSVPLRDEVTGPLKPMLLMLVGAVGFVLLIVCVNVANLLMMRSVGRQKEMAVRLAIGAGRFRLLRQFLVEGMLLAFTGGALGLVLAVWLKDILVAHMPESIPQFHAIELDWTVLLFSFLLVTLAGLAFSVLPTLWASRTDFNPALQESGRGNSQGPDHQRLRAVFVIVEVALSVILLIGAGLLMHSFQRVLRTNPGFRPEHVLTASIDLPPTEYSQDEKVASFYKQLMEKLSRMPGGAAAGGSTDLPLLGGWTHAFTVEGYQPPPGPQLSLGNHSVIYGDYLQAMGIPLLRGRYFTELDGPKSTHVLIVSESLAKKYWPGQDPLGKRLKWGPPESTDPWLTVVGVVGDVKQGPLETAADAHTYEPYAQLGAPLSLRVAVRGQADPAGLAVDVRAVVRSLDRQLALGNVRTMDEVISRSTASRRFSLVLVGSFAALALVLAAIGIYAVLAYSVARRTHEIGVRMALGARSGDVVRLVLSQGLRVTAIGIVFGVAGALGLTRFLQSLLYEVRPTDPPTFVGVLLVLVGVSVAASYLPARRAMRVDPIVALRYE